MALDSAPLIWVQRKTAFALETTTGTKATLAATDAVTRCFDTDIAYDWDTVDRPRSDMLPTNQRYGQKRAQPTLSHEFYGGSTTLPHWIRLLRMAGFTDTATAKVFKPVFPSIVTGTIATYRPGLFKAAIGCVTSGVLTIEDAKPGRWDWTAMGLADVPDGTTAVSGITYEDTAPLQGVATLSIGTGAGLVVPSIKIDLGNQMVIRGDVSGVDSATPGNPTGGRSGYIVDLKPTVTINPEGVGLSVRDWYAIHRNYTDVAMSIRMGSGSNTCLITSPKMRLNAPPNEQNDNGMLRNALVFTPCGDDATAYLTFDFTATS